MDQVLLELIAFLRVQNTWLTLQTSPAIMREKEKEGKGSPLFSCLNGVQVAGGSNPPTPTIDRRDKV